MEDAGMYDKVFLCPLAAALSSRRTWYEREASNGEQHRVQGLL